MKIIEDMSNKDYHNDTAVNASLIKKMAVSMAKARDSLLHKTVQTPAMLQGTITHSLILEPDSFHNNYVVGEKFDKRTKAGKEAFAQFEAENIGKTIISKEQFDIASACMDSVFKHRAASKLLLSGKAEESIFSDMDGLPVRIRTDWRNDKTIVDLKTCQDASPAGFAKAVLNFRYDIQAAFYIDVLGADEFYFIAVETSSPYSTAVYTLPDNVIKKARVEYKELLLQWKLCLETDYYPAYSEEAVELSMPGWYKAA